MVKTITDYKEGDILEFRKPHPCGGKEWEVIRYGINCRLKCLRCGRIIILSRIEISRKIKKTIKKKKAETL